MRTHVEEPKHPRAARRVIAVLESEADGGELASVFAERGARVVRVAATSEVFYHQLEEVRRLLDELAAARYELVVFMTGRAVSCLVELARELGRSGDLTSALRRIPTVCRGPKARAALRNYGLVPMFNAQPLNDARLVHGLGKLVRPGQRVLRFNGDLLDPLLEKLHQQHAQVREISLDSFVSPNDSGEGSTLVRAIVQGRVEALIVTSEVQFARLYQVATRLDLAREMVQVLRRDVVVATSEDCAAALEAHGLHPQLMPAQPQMLVMALMLFLEKGKAAIDSPGASQRGWTDRRGQRRA